MAEDMTYDAEPTRAQLVAALREQCELAATLMQQRTELERENAELRAKVDAVPYYTFACLQAKERGEVSVWPSLDEWLEMGEPDGNGDDAPLTLAAIDDEDGDE